MTPHASRAVLFAAFALAWTGCPNEEQARRAKAKEAHLNVKRLQQAAAAYFEEEHVGPDGKLLPKQYPASVGPTPAGSPCDGPDRRYRPNPKAWEHPTWKALRFSVNDTHYYRYSFESKGTGANAGFTARANGDLNCDGVWSTWETIGLVDAQGKPQLGAGIYGFRGLE